MQLCIQDIQAEAYIYPTAHAYFAVLATIASQVAESVPGAGHTGRECNTAAALQCNYHWPMVPAGTARRCVLHQVWPPDHLVLQGCPYIGTPVHGSQYSRR